MRRKSSLCAALLAACSSGVPSIVGDIQTQSQVLLSAPPEVGDSGGRPGSSYLLPATGAGPNSVAFEDDAGLNSEVVSFPGEVAVLVVYPWRDAQGEITHYLVGCVASNDVFTLYRLHDTNGDNVPEAASKQVLFSSGSSAAYVTDLGRVGQTGKIYLLDARCQDVLVAADTDQDGFPDSLQNTPFAQAAVYPELVKARVLIVESDDRVSTVASSLFIRRRERHNLDGIRGPYRRFADSDADGIADQETEWFRPDPFPLVYGKPYDGQSVMKVKGESGEVVQVWKLDADFSPQTMLGSATLSGVDWQSIAFVSSLAKDQILRVQYVGRESSALQLTVWEAWPQVFSIGPDTLTLTGGIVAIQGLNLNGSTLAKLHTEYDPATRSFATVQVVALTVQDTESGSVQIPSLPASAEGRAEITLEDPNAPGAHGINYHSISICTPAGE